MADGTRLFEYRALEFEEVDDTKHAGIYAIEGTDG